MARPTEYRQEYAEQARKLCLLGYTDKQLADFFGVNESTITRWKQKHPEFCMSIKMGKIVADAEVVQSLYKKALGYRFTEVEVKTEGKKTTKRVIQKESPPDTTAQIFWLKNRQPSVWRDKPIAEEQQQEPTPVQIVVAAVDARIKDGDDQSSS